MDGWLSNYLHNSPAYVKNGMRCLWIQTYFSLLQILISHIWDSLKLLLYNCLFYCFGLISKLHRSFVIAQFLFWAAKKERLRDKLMIQNSIIWWLWGKTHFVVHSKSSGKRYVVNKNKSARVRRWLDKGNLFHRSWINFLSHRIVKWFMIGDLWIKQFLRWNFWLFEQNHKTLFFELTKC